MIAISCNHETMAKHVEFPIEIDNTGLSFALFMVDKMLVGNIVLQ